MQEFLARKELFLFPYVFPDVTVDHPQVRAIWGKCALPRAWFFDDESHHIPFRSMSGLRRRKRGELRKFQGLSFFAYASIA